MLPRAKCLGAKKRPRPPDGPPLFLKHHQPDGPPPAHVLAAAAAKAEEERLAAEADAKAEEEERLAAEAAAKAEEERLAQLLTAENVMNWISIYGMDSSERQLLIRLLCNSLAPIPDEDL